MAVLAGFGYVGAGGGGAVRAGGWLVALLLGLGVVGLLLVPGVAVGQQTECLTEVNAAAPPGAEGMVDPGVALPVLLVHGFGSSAESMRQLRIAIQGFSVDTSVSLFDYSPWALEWVVHPEIGDRLGEVIRCLADTSLANGGPGRVAVMAHSMGGLAVREALGGDPGMGDQVAVVVTFGTPFAGSNWARDDAAELGNALLVPLLEIGRSLDVDWVPHPDQLDRMATSSARAGMTPGSAELAALPAWPENVAVFNDAGQFKIEKRFFFWTSEEDYGDLIVDQPSATSGGQTVDQLGGSFTSECRAYLPDDIADGLVEVTVQVAALRYIVSQDPLFPFCNHFWLTNNRQLIDNALAQLAAASSRTPRDTEPVPPRQLSPADGTVFDHFPRETTFSWEPVDGASAYEVEVKVGQPDSTGKWPNKASDCCWIEQGLNSGWILQTTQTRLDFVFVGAQPGRWRVRSVYSDGSQSPWSDWWIFVYLQ